MYKMVTGDRSPHAGVVQGEDQLGVCEGLVVVPEGEVDAGHVAEDLRHLAHLLLLPPPTAGDTQQGGSGK